MLRRNARKPTAHPQRPSNLPPSLRQRRLLHRGTHAILEHLGPFHPSKGLRRTFSRSHLHFLDLLLQQGDYTYELILQVSNRTFPEWPHRGQRLSILIVWHSQIRSLRRNCVFVVQLGHRWIRWGRTSESRVDCQTGDRLVDRLLDNYDGYA